ncbi:hypothetical protein KY327_03965 [Candidatus Woesearchaeota archaeon]|nr:hypothetical protein [Candidatus Woesearchaeota archaeon]
MNTGTKQSLIKTIIIRGFHGFLDTATKEGLDDGCTVKAYYYLQGLRDTIKDEDKTDERWLTGEEVKKQAQDLLLTLSQYNNHRIRELKKDILKKAKKQFPGIETPFSFKAHLNKMVGRRRLLHVMRRERKDSTSPEKR